MQFTAVGLTIAAGVQAEESCTRCFIVVVKCRSSFVDSIKYHILNAGADLVTDLWWCFDVNFKVRVRINHGYRSRVLGYSELDAVFGHEDGRPSARKYSLPLAVVDQVHHQTTKDSIARPSVREVDEKRSYCWGEHTMSVKLPRG